MLSDPASVSVKACLRRQGLPRLEIQMMLSEVLGRPRQWLIAHDDHILSTVQLKQFDGMVTRRLAGEPMAYLLGRREFMGLSLVVGPDVLIPRPETELLVHTVLEAVEGQTTPAILDVGTGSGAIAVALAHARPDAQIWATDICGRALDIAQCNALNHAAKIEFCCGDWFDALPEHAPVYDVVVSNPPYIHPNDSHLTEGDLRFEPRRALTENVDGLSAYRVLARACQAYLARGGRLCVEHGFDQQEAVSEIFTESGLQNVETFRDLAGHPRVTTASYNG